MFSTTIDSEESHVFDVEQKIAKYERRHGRRERYFIHRTHPMRIPCVSSELYATTFAEEPMGVRLPRCWRPAIPPDHQGRGEN